MTPDPLGAAELRERVLTAWRASPARFRADANLEDDLALVGYRDRVVVELAQNAADAAVRAGVAGRLVLTLSGGTLSAANVGAPLDAAGVESIAVSRASAKVDQPEAVGRFGVGFAAVLAVSDAPRVVSRHGSVEWSRAKATELVAGVPELSVELQRRGTRVPVLRLPFAADAAAAPDADTVVELPLRDAAAEAAVRGQLASLDPTLLLALPGLREIVVRVEGRPERVLRTEVDGRRVTTYDGDLVSHWWVARDTGPLPAELRVGPGDAERADRGWQVTWAIPVTDDDTVVTLPDAVSQVVRAPTPTDDPMTLPAVLIASYPLDATRRRITQGPVADFVTHRAATTLAAAVIELPASAGVLRLVPAGLPHAAVDGALHAAVLEVLCESAWLPVAGDRAERRRPGEVSVVHAALVEPLAEVMPALLPADWSGPSLTALGVHRPSVTELVEALAAASMPPRWWHQVYAGFETAVPAGPQRDALGALPVPLTDGSTVLGPRGVAVADDMPDGLTALNLTAVGVRLVHPDAAHPLLRLLGAADGSPRALLELPQVRAAVEASYDAEDPQPVAAAALGLLAATAATSDELPWLAELALPTEDGQWRPAGELLVPEGLMARVVVPDSGLGVISSDYVATWGVATLTAAGVLDGPAVLRVDDPPGPGHDLDREHEWWATLPADAALTSLAAIRDLELVRPDRLPEIVERLAAPPYRDVVVSPATVIDRGVPRRVVSYTAWWLSTQPVLEGASPRDGRLTPRDLRLATSDLALVGLYDVAPATLDPEFARAIGVAETIGDLDPDDLLARLADPARPVSRAQLRALYDWLADQSVTAPLTAPSRVRAVRREAVIVVDAADAVIADAPDLVPLLGDLAVVPVVVAKAMRLATRLDLPLASELADFEVVSTGAGLDETTEAAVVHHPLRVRDVEGRATEVSWRLVDGVLHVDRTRRAHGLGRGRAWRAGEWSRRHRLTEELIGTESGMLLDDEDDFDNAG